MLLASFFPLLILILAVLGSIVFGLATPTEAAAVGALGGFLLAAAYKQLNFGVVKESVFLTAKTSAMVAWVARDRIITWPARKDYYRIRGRSTPVERGRKNSRLPGGPRPHAGRVVR